MHRENPTLKDPHHFFNAISRSDELLLQNHRDGVKALANVALEFANDDTKFSRVERHQFNVIGKLPNFANAIHYLNKDDYFDPAEKRRDKQVVVDYNHALREMIDDNPQLLMQDVTDFTQKAMLQIAHDPRQSAAVSESTRDILNGMRHEIAAENTFWQIDDVEDVRPATDDEDLHGIDLVVTYRGRDYGFDIKASLEAADEANRKNHNVPAMASGFNWEDFGPRMRASQEATDRNVSYYYDMLQWCEAKHIYLQKAG